MENMNNRITESIIKETREKLKKNSDQHTKATGQNFFKEKVKTYGVKTIIVSKIAKSYDQDILTLNKNEVFTICEELWKSGYMEESFIACHWSYLIRKKYQPSDFDVFTKWVNDYVSNWASCDTLCNHTVGAFMEMYRTHYSKTHKNH